jgi:hypothetical protein
MITIITTMTTIMTTIMTMITARPNRKRARRSLPKRARRPDAARRPGAPIGYAVVRRIARCRAEEKECVTRSKPT